MRTKYFLLCFMIKMLMCSSISHSHYLLLTPGPLTTSKSVKETMLNDYCTWDEDYKHIVQTIRQKLVSYATKKLNYTSVLLQGSGSYCIEAVLQSFIGNRDKALIIINGAYGERMAKMCEYTGINHTQLIYAENDPPKLDDIEQALINDPSITHVIAVHCETTSGIVNPILEICALAKKYSKTTIIDAMSSFGGMPIDMDEWQIDVLVSSANKCLQGVPGFSFAICKESLIKEAIHSRSLCLDLNAQWQTMNPNGKWRYTSPTHSVRAFLQALIELDDEGGVIARFNRYKKNQQLLSQGMSNLGFKMPVAPSNQSAFITSFLYPADNFDFLEFYTQLKQAGFVIYPGKITDTSCFRIGNIGEVYPEDIERLLKAVKNAQIKMSTVVTASSNSLVRGVIFDIAGTIIDHGSIAPIIAFQELFKSIGIPITETEARLPMGSEKREHIRQLLAMPRIYEKWISLYQSAPDEHAINRLYQGFVDHLMIAINQTATPVSGLMQTLQFLKDNGIKVGCNTGYSRQIVDEIKLHFDRLGFTPDSLICATDVTRGRPFPDMSLKNAEELGLDQPDTGIKVDDTIVGIQAGLNAGMWTVGVATSGNEVGLSESDWNNLSTEEKDHRKAKAYKNLYDAGAHFVIDSIADMPSVIDEINQRLANGQKP